jgi:hypothetical protein
MKPNNFRALIEEAISHPELKFKLAMDLTQEEFDEMAGSSEDIPSNVYFSPATRAQVSEGKTLSYGRKRTYREFLNGILDGTEQGLNEDEFAQMWILNHPDNSRFVFDTARGGERLKEILFGSKDNKTGGIIAKAGGQMDGAKYRDILPLDISEFVNDQDRPALNNLVKIKEENGKITEVTWAPCIIINGSYYIAESGTDLGFNVAFGPAGLKMNYRKVEPWGSSKSIEYDGNKKLAPKMRYQTSMQAVPTRNTNYVAPEPVDPFDQRHANNTGTQSNQPQLGDSSEIQRVLDDIKAYQGGREHPQLQSAFNKMLKITNTDMAEIANIVREIAWPEGYARRVKMSTELENRLIEAIYNRNNNTQTAGPSNSNFGASPESLIERGNGNANGINMSRQQMEDYIFDEYVKAVEAKEGPLAPEDKQNMRAEMSQGSDEDIAIAVQMIRKACRQNGIMVLDEEGNPMQGC